MKPIHHSKLKKGDLIYVESQNKIGNFFMVDFVNKFWYMKKDNLGYYPSNGQNEFIFLIERGYFL